MFPEGYRKCLLHWEMTSGTCSLFGVPGSTVPPRALVGLWSRISPIFPREGGLSCWILLGDDFVKMFIQHFWLDSRFPLMSQSPELNSTHFRCEDGRPCRWERHLLVLTATCGLVLDHGARADGPSPLLAYKAGLLTATCVWCSPRVSLPVVTTGTEESCPYAACGGTCSLSSYAECLPHGGIVGFKDVARDIDDRAN